MDDDNNKTGTRRLCEVSWGKGGGALSVHWLSNYFKLEFFWIAHNLVKVNTRRVRSLQLATQSDALLQQAAAARCSSSACSSTAAATPPPAQHTVRPCYCWRRATRDTRRATCDMRHATRPTFSVCVFNLASSGFVS